MNTLKKTDFFTTGLAIFTMFFGAGNIIFPLALGQNALDKSGWGLAGLLLTGVAMPFAGLIAMFRYGGQIKLFFGRLGKIPGLVIATLTIALLGPFGGAPRCIALAHSTISTSLPGTPLILFSAICCIFIFFFAYKKNQLMKLLGIVLSPLKITLLIVIIVKGFMESPSVLLTSSEPSEIVHFWHGLTEGYKTMDLVAAFFFAPIVIASLSKESESPDFTSFVWKASGVGAFLLSTIYIGFCYLAYAYAPQLEGVSNDQILGTIAIQILGPYAGLIVSLTVTIACLSTAIALVAAFTNFVHKEIFGEKIHHLILLTISLATTFAITTLEFQGIARLLNPILEVCYPGLIALTLYNLVMPLQTTKQKEVVL